MVPVVILDRDKQTRQNLSLVLSASNVMAEEYELASKYLDGMIFKEPHVALISLNQDGFDGIDLLHLVRSQSNALSVFASIDRPDTGLTVAAMKAGCADVLQKPIKAEPLINAAIGTSALGAGSSAVPDKRSTMTALTGREHDVLKCLLANQSNKQIASKLAVSVRTIETHRAKLYSKLRVNSQAELVKKWSV